MNTVQFKCLNKVVIFLCFVITTLLAFPPEYDSLVAQKVVSYLSIENFKFNIKSLSDIGDRLYGSASNVTSQEWLESTLEETGYVVTIQSNYKNIMCTKVGTISPDSGYIIGAHFDGRGGGGAADDNASGTSLILEAARVLLDPNLKTRYSIRFILFNCEETGISGSNSYVQTRKSLQGEEDPVGSGIYPEPLWLGMIAHDMLLYDHGIPWDEDQIPDADIDVEYLAGTSMANQSEELANTLVEGSEAYSENYPAQVGTEMTLTDSDPFKNIVAAVSVRENRRKTEIGSNSNPNYHKNTDLYETYSELDFLLGFNAVQMTVGTICRLAGIHDSSVTAINPKIKNSIGNKFPLSSKITGITIYNARGKKITEISNSINLQNLYKSISNHKLLSRGIYIIKINRTSYGPQYKVLPVH